MSSNSARASARPVAFCLHALGASSVEFSHLRDALAGEIEVVAIDLPGFGDTAWVDGASVEETVEFVIRRIRAHGAARWMLVGHSMGGKIASIIAARTLSGRAPLFGLAGVVLLAASPVTPEPTSEDHRELMIGWASESHSASDGHLSDESAREFVDANIAEPLAETDMASAVSGVRRTDPLAWRAWLERGETLGVVGESGCGKSTLARTLLMLEHPDEGTVRFGGVDPFALKGKELLAWRRRVQMVFQDPFAALNARMTAGEIISEPWASHRDLPRTSRERDARMRELLQLVGLRPSDAGKSPQEFSGGQRQRIGIAHALALDPDVIVLDEPVSALDLSVQAQVLNLLGELQQRLGVAFVLISHDLSVIRHVTDRVAVMYLGRIVETGPTEEVFDRPRHPYTAALMSASPTLDVSATGRKQRIVLQGEIPSPLDPPSGCRFRTRCWKAQDVCATVAPLPEADPGDPLHVSECHFPLWEPDDASVLAATT